MSYCQYNSNTLIKVLNELNYNSKYLKNVLILVLRINRVQPVLAKCCLYRRNMTRNVI